MDKIKASLTDNTRMFDKIGDQIPPLKKLAHDQKLNSGAFVAVALFFASLLILIFHGVELAVCSYTIIYPAFRSIRAIETDEKDDDKTWLCYWVIIGVLEVLETFFGFIFWFIPFWKWVRVIFFVYMISFGGAEVMLNKLLPLIKAHQSEIQAVIDQVTEVANDAAQEAKKQVTDPALLMKGVNAVSQAQAAMASNEKKEE